jgi:hypothetical protein
VKLKLMEKMKVKGKEKQPAETNHRSPCHPHPCTFYVLLRLRVSSTLPFYPFLRFCTSLRTHHSLDLFPLIVLR